MISNYKYEYAFVDAQLYLTRNWMVQKSQPYFNAQGLTKSFIQSIVKLVRDEINTKNVVLLWDKSPYHKVSLVESYKGDREYRGEHNITDDMTEEEKEKLRKETHQFQIRQKVKYDLVFNSYKLGMPSIILGGYESDDFGYLASISNLVQSAPNKSIMVSKDGDWAYFVNDKVDMYRITKLPEYYTHESKQEELQGVNAYKYKSIIDSLYGSHNYLTSTKCPNFEGTPHDVIAMLDNNDLSFAADTKLFTDQLNSFKVWEYPDYEKATWMINNIPLKAEFMDSTTFDQYCLNNGLNITSKYYQSFLDALNRP